MRDVVICEPLRTPVGAFAGGFKNIQPETLATAVVSAIMEKTGFPGELVGDVIFANCYPTMEAPAIGRVISLNAKLPVTACGYQIDRRCGSGLQAIINGVMQVASGGMDCVIAGGAESMSRAPFYSVDMRWGAGSPGVMLKDGLTRGRVTPYSRRRTSFLSGPISVRVQLRHQANSLRRSFRSQCRTARAILSSIRMSIFAMSRAWNPCRSFGRSA